MKTGARGVILQRETIQHGVYANTNIKMKERLSILKEWGAACYYFYYETGTGTSSAWHQEAEGQTWGAICRREVVGRFGALMTGL